MMQQSPGSPTVINIPNPSETVGIFAKHVLATDLEGALIKTSLVLSTLFILVWIIQQTYKIVIQEIPLDKSEVIKVVALIGVLVFYSSLMHDIVDEYMGALVSVVKDLIPNPEDRRAQIIEQMTKSTRDVRGDVVNIGEAVKGAIMSVMVQFVKTLDDVVSYVFELYVEISLFFVRSFGPLAITFTLFPGLGGTFMKWFKLYIKFHLYAMVINTGVLLAKSFLFMYFDDALVAGGTEGILLLNPVTGFWTLVSVLVAFMVFKVLYTILGFKILDNLFGGRDVGLGSMIGGMVAAGSSVVMTAATAMSPATGAATSTKGATDVDKRAMPK